MSQLSVEVRPVLTPALKQHAGAGPRVDRDVHAVPVLDLLAEVVGEGHQVATWPTRVGFRSNRSRHGVATAIRQPRIAGATMLYGIVVGCASTSVLSVTVKLP